MVVQIPHRPPRAPNPGLSRLQLYRAATRVGRAHIAPTVNTIVLAYAGASLPLLPLQLTADSRPVTEILTTGFMAQEIVRSAVATLGLIAAVPLTTGLAAVVTRPRRPDDRFPGGPPRPTDSPARWAGREGSTDSAW